MLFRSESAILTTHPRRVLSQDMSGKHRSMPKIENGEMPSETFDKSITFYAKQITEELLAMDFPKDEKERLVCPKCQKLNVKLFEKVAKCTDETCGWRLFRNICDKVLSGNDIRCRKRGPKICI